MVTAQTLNTVGLALGMLGVRLNLRWFVHTFSILLTVIAH